MKIKKKTTTKQGTYSVGDSYLGASSPRRLQQMCGSVRGGVVVHISWNTEDFAKLQLGSAVFLQAGSSTSSTFTRPWNSILPQLRPAGPHTQTPTFKKRSWKQRKGANMCFNPHLKGSQTHLFLQEISLFFLLHYIQNLIPRKCLFLSKVSACMLLKLLPPTLYSLLFGLWFLFAHIPW